MSFYHLSKQERVDTVAKISDTLLGDFKKGKIKSIVSYFSDEDTYIRKSAYLCVGRIYFSNKELQPVILHTLTLLSQKEDFK